MHVSDVKSPLGLIRIVADAAAVVAVSFNPESSPKLNKVGLTGQEQPNQISQQAALQIDEYFSGERTCFDLPISFGKRSAFGQSILDGLISVPYGETWSYGALAAKCHYPKAARAVGRVMASNPIPIIVPCHRIVGSSGKLTGYSGGDGVSTKKWLLDFEAGDGSAE